jgi:hypothetical protein
MKPTRLAVVIATALSAPLACSDPTYQDCHNIPSGGCPGGDATNCEDPTCVEIYSCEANGSWTPVVRCPPHEAGVDAGRGVDGSGVDATVIREASLRDVDFKLPEGAAGGPDCIELESPDCPLELALACSMSCCGCQDLWVCEDGSWNIWGACSEAGVPEPVSSP